MSTSSFCCIGLKNLFRGISGDRSKRRKATNERTPLARNDDETKPKSKQWPPPKPPSSCSMQTVNERFTTNKQFHEEDFTKLRTLGKGGFGTVVLVQHNQTRVFYAMKIVEKSALEKSDRPIDAFIERDIMKRLKHPNVLYLHDTFLSDTQLFFLMDYLPGGDMVSFLKRVPEQRVTLSDARNWAAQVYLGLVFVHAHGVLYRDLKPENMLLTREGGLVLADFGLAKAFDDQQDLMSEGATSIVGSPFYIAPEILEVRRKGAYAQSSDWWSYGVLLYRLIYGRNPFTGQTRDELKSNIRRQPVQFPRNVANDEEARDLIGRLLEKDPTKRINGADIGSHPFFAGVNWDALAEGNIPKPQCWVTPPTIDELLGRR